MHALSVERRCIRMIMSTFGKSRSVYLIAQKYPLIALGWMRSHDRNLCWNPVKYLFGVLPARCTATSFHFFMDAPF